MIRYLTFRALGFFWRYLVLPALVLAAIPILLVLFLVFGETRPPRQLADG